MIRQLSNLFQSLFRRRRIEDDLDAEMRASLDLIADRNRARGMSTEEAKRAARLEFEGVDRVKEQVRDRLTGASLYTGLQDLRYAWRGLWRQPSFAVIAVVNSRARNRCERRHFQRLLRCFAASAAVPST
jgi:hypothetical protein